MLLSFCFLQYLSARRNRGIRIDERVWTSLRASSPPCNIDPLRPLLPIQSSSHRVAAFLVSGSPLFFLSLLKKKSLKNWTPRRIYKKKRKKERKKSRERSSFVWIIWMFKAFKKCKSVALRERTFYSRCVCNIEHSLKWDYAALAEQSTAHTRAAWPFKFGWIIKIGVEKKERKKKTSIPQKKPRRRRKQIQPPPPHHTENSLLRVAIQSAVAAVLLQCSSTLIGSDE